MYYVLTDGMETVNMPFLLSEAQKVLGKKFEPYATNTESGTIWLKDLENGDIKVSYEKEDDSAEWSMLVLPTIHNRLNLEKMILASTLKKVQTLELLV